MIDIPRKGVGIYDHLFARPSRRRVNEHFPIPRDGDPSKLRDDVFWFLPVRDHHGKPKMAKRAFVADIPYDPEKDLGARAVLHDGTVETAGFSYSRNGKDFYMFRSGGIRQAASSIVRIEINIGNPNREDEVKKVTLYKKPFESEDIKVPNYDTDILELSLPSENSNVASKKIEERVVEICLFNLEFDEVVAQRFPEDDIEAYRRRLRLEFPFLLRMLEEPWDVSLPDLLNRSEHQRERYRRRGKDRAKHNPWNSWITPDSDGENPPTNGTCIPQTAKDPNSGSGG